MNSFEKRQRAQSAAAIVGVDAGKFNHALIVRPRGGHDSRPITLTTSRAGFDDAVERILKITRLAHPSAGPADILVGIEFAGSYGFTFAHYLHLRGFQIVNVLASDTKRWKEVMHHQALKTDAKDALGITDLVSQGHFVRTAATFIGAAGDVQAYASSRQILRLAGLSLVEASSGVHKGRERLSKRGRPVLRRHAFLFALRCVRAGGLFKTQFDAMVQRNGGVKLKALAALSREVLKIVYTVARERRPFVAVHVPADQRPTHASAPVSGDRPAGARRRRR